MFCLSTEEIQILKVLFSVGVGAFIVSILMDWIHDE
jgi:hypothetical protein